MTPPARGEQPEQPPPAGSESAPEGTSEPAVVRQPGQNPPPGPPRANQESPPPAVRGGDGTAAERVSRAAAASDGDYVRVTAADMLEVLEAAGRGDEVLTKVARNKVDEGRGDAEMMVHREAHLKGVV